MHEITDLQTIAIEINHYKKMTVQNIIEIGKRLNDAKELVDHGEWGNWLLNNVDFSRMQANRYMRVAEEYSNVTTSIHLPISKAFELLSIPAEIREEFIKENDVEDMTTRELREEIRKRKALEKENKELKGQKPKVVEKEVVKTVIPDDYEDLKEKSKKHSKEVAGYQKQLRDLADENLKNFKARSDLEIKNKQILEELPTNKRNKKLVADTWSFVRGVESLLKDFGGMVYLTQSINELPDHERSYYINAIENLHGWASQIKFNLEEEIKK